MAKIASFKDVISDKFYDVIFSALSAHIEENPARLGCRSSYVEEPEEARLEDMEVRLLSITGTTSTELKFDVVVSVEIEIAETVRRERESDSAEQWFRVSCSCDISNGIKNFRVEDFHIYSKSRAGKPGQLSDYLIPIIHKDELDTVAEDFLRQYYPEALEKPMPVSSAELAERMGLTIRQEHITKTCSVFGQVFFADCLVPCYDEEKGVYHEVAVEEGTILVDPDVFFMYTLGSYNNTIVHECVHWGLHRRFFELEKLYNEEAKSIVCQVKEGDAPEKKRSPLEWMEWQANHLSPRILMPISTTKIKINELFAEKKAQSPEAAPSEIMEQVVASLADFFGVSKQSAKIRMIDLGYTDAIGVFNYTEDGYVQSHSFKSKAVGKNQTFVATEADLAIAFLTKPEFKSMMESGRYVYVDKHVCINDKKYIGRTAAGTAVLTDYAMQHMDECCLVNQWRAANPHITKYWWDCDAAAFTAVQDKTEATVGRVTFSWRSGILFITLPSGRKLSYIKPRLATNRFGRTGLTYEGVGESKKWLRIETYGPKLVENIVQATARDLLAEGMLRLRNAGFDIVMHVHDEAVIEVPHGASSVEEVCRIMAEAPAWADGLPLRADGYECDFYKKD